MTPMSKIIQQSSRVLLQVYIAPVDKEDLLKQIQALLTEPLGEDFAMVAPALAKARSLPSLADENYACLLFV